MRVLELVVQHALVQRLLDGLANVQIVLVVVIQPVATVAGLTVAQTVEQHVLMAAVLTVLITVVLIARIHVVAIVHLIADLRVKIIAGLIVQTTAEQVVPTLVGQIVRTLVEETAQIIAGIAVLLDVVHHVKMLVDLPAQTPVKDVRADVQGVARMLAQIVALHNVIMAVKIYANIIVPAYVEQCALLGVMVVVITNAKKPVGLHVLGIVQTCALVAVKHAEQLVLPIVQQHVLADVEMIVLRTVVQAVVNYVIISVAAVQVALVSV